MRTAAELLSEDHAEVSNRINTIIDNRTRPLHKRLWDVILTLIGEIVNNSPGG